MAFERELETALTACMRAGEVQERERSRHKLIDIKEDCSPVTQVDRECERVIIETLERKFPRDGFLGEETGLREGASGRRWIIDPLDGTRPYIRGIPTYSSIVALQEESEIVVGVIHLPEMKQTCLARKGGGAFCNGVPVHVSATARLQDAIGSSLGFIERCDCHEGRGLMQLMRAWNYSYGFMDAYSYVCVARGALDVCVNLLDKVWDCAAGACIITEAGGRFSDIKGNASVHNGSTVLSNGILHERILEYFV